MQAELSPAELELRRMELEIRAQEVTLPIELAKLGLRGALTGALAGCLMVIVLAGIAAFSDKAQITGLHLCIMMAIVAVAVALYGGFVFKRSLLISGDWKDKRLNVSTDEARAASAHTSSPAQVPGPD